MNTQVGEFMCDVFIVYILDVNAHLFQVCVARCVCLCLCAGRAQPRHLRGSISVFMIAGGGGARRDILSSVGVL